jgi:prophage regulatory protein
MNLLRIPDVKKASGLARPTIYRDIKRGTFPKPVKLGTVSAWPEREVHSIINARVAGKSDDDIRQLVVQLHEQRTNAA